MNQINDKQSYYLLRMNGFTTVEIHRIFQLRQCYRASELDQAPLNHARLEFVRWLVTTGRLTDQETSNETSCKLDKVSLNPSPSHILPITLGLSEKSMPFPTKRSIVGRLYTFLFIPIISLCKAIAFEMTQPTPEPSLQSSRHPAIYRVKRRFSTTMLY